MPRCHVQLSTLLTPLLAISDSTGVNLSMAAMTRLAEGRQCGAVRGRVDGLARAGAGRWRRPDGARASVCDYGHVESCSPI